MNSKQKEEKAIIKTEAKFLPISPRKLRLIVEAAKKMRPEQAVKQLSFSNKKGSKFLVKAIKTALADAEHNFDLNKDNLVFDEILVNEGPALKRRDKSKRMFRYGIIRKRRSHLIVKVREK
jgi:large subunit ribosomal protein L22